MKTFSVWINASNEKILKENGFINLTSCYYMKRKLYENKITLTITIEKESKNVTVEVYDEMLKHIYTPFYNIDYNQNNKVLDEVIKKYDSIIKDLVEKDILKLNCEEHNE